MTFSIVATDGEAYGVAVASKFLAVGGIVPLARPGVGAVATQSLAKVSYREDILDLLAAGDDAQTAIEKVTAADPLSMHRQVGVVGVDSQASFTGSECLPWAGCLSGGDESGRYAIQGNILAGEQVIKEMERAWLESIGMPLQRRLLAALFTGDSVGGDSRGRQAAALYVVSPGGGYDQSGVLVDLRVDDHRQAPTELARILDVHDLYFGQPEDVTPLVGQLADEVSGRLAVLGYSDDLEVALDNWAGVENYEMRLVPGGIDARVLKVLRAATVGEWDPDMRQQQTVREQ